MNSKKSNILDEVVNHDLCIGCGACVYQNQTNEWMMDWNKDGFLVPTTKENSFLITESTIKVCPFNPAPTDEVRTEDELADLFLQEAPNNHPKVGKYFNTYAGYSEQFRLTSSSGGLATYILTELFEQKLIDAVIAVGEGKNNHYEYKLVRKKEELLATSKTKYYPVTMIDALKELQSFEGKVAVVGIGCFIKAIRLLQHYNPELREKIVFTVGIICGGLKSKFFGEYLAGKAGVKKNTFNNPQFRIKDYDSTAGDYSFGCMDKDGKEKQVKMRTVGDMWGTGMFKCNACDFCDDVTTELADISLGDAWLDPFVKDGKGTNVVVTRSALADKLINEGICTSKLALQLLPFDVFLSSQQGSYNHRHKALKYRIHLTEQKDVVIPPKRHNQENVSLIFKCVQKQRMKVRRKSLEIWFQSHNSQFFDVEIKKYLNHLQFTTKLYHYIRNFTKVLNG
jgi:coenzyme F420 hydrogenase subunit beta